MRLFSTIILFLVAAFVTTMATFLAIDGNLTRITGWYRFKPGMPLFSHEYISRINEVDWMRISDLHDSITCVRDDKGVWWITEPFHDRLSPEVVQTILNFTVKARLVDTLPLNHTTRENMREFGVESAPLKVVLKVPEGDRHTTLARYTLGSASPWLADAEDGKSLLPTSYLRTNQYGRDKRIHVVTGNILSIFKNGLSALRDSRPLLLDKNAVKEISIAHPQSKETLKITRQSAEMPWVINSPIVTAGDNDNINALLNNLCNISATNVQELVDVDLPKTPQCKISLSGDWGDKPIELSLYEPFKDELSERELCYATVSDRKVVFCLQASQKIRKQGSYGNLINAICRLPVLPDKALAQVRMSHLNVYTNDLPLTLPQLRSLQFTNLDSKDIARVSLRSAKGEGAIRLMLIPGDADSQVEDTWMYASAFGAFDHAEKSTVTRFLNSLSDIPVDEIVVDERPGINMQEKAKEYGLHHPDYVLSLLPKPCQVRTTLFGQDLPLVKDRSPRMYLLKRAEDAATGESCTYAMEIGGSTICKLSKKLTSQLSFLPENWKQLNIMQFPISSVRRLCLNYQQAPLVLDYDYIGETWTGTLGGKDITPNINPHRAGHYIRNLQQMKVEQWLSPWDQDALAALRQPAFDIQLHLEIVDYSDADKTVVDQEMADDTDTEAKPEDLLQENPADTWDEEMRRMALGERKVHKETISLEIAPCSGNADRPFFYGRIKESGELFIIKYEAAQGLAGSLLDM